MLARVMRVYASDDNCLLLISIHGIGDLRYIFARDQASSCGRAPGDWGLQIPPIWGKSFFG
jgi:hypothetical protein